MKEMKMEETKKLKCVVCGREFSCSDSYVEYVAQGRLESICGYCDGSHDVQ